MSLNSKKEADQRHTMPANTILHNKHLSAPIGYLLEMTGNLEVCTSERWQRVAAWRCEQPLDGRMHSLHALFACPHNVSISELEVEVCMHAPRLCKLFDEHAEHTWAALVEESERHTMAHILSIRPFNALPHGQTLLGMLLPFLIWRPDAQQSVWEVIPICMFVDDLLTPIRLHRGEAVQNGAAHVRRDTRQPEYELPAICPAYVLHHLFPIVRAPAPMLALTSQGNGRAHLQPLAKT